MSSTLPLAWFIPILPLLTGLLVGVLLISFSRTMNRLTKPVFYIVIGSLVISALISLLLYSQHVTGEILGSRISLYNYNLPLSLYLDRSTELISLAIQLAFIVLIVYSFLSSNRSKGYVRNISLLALSCSLLLTYILSSYFPKGLF